MNFTYLSGTHVIYMNILFLRSLNRDSKCKNEMEKNYLDVSAFALVFL